jgi:two-component system, chemotaxis family, CheB/CheR fusion protein
MTMNIGTPPSDPGNVPGPPSETDEAESPAAAARTYVVGVGASAGGLEALQRLFARMRRTGAFSFVVVQHLSPDFKSVMAELLAQHTELTVRVVEDGMEVETDTVYLLPAGNEMTIREGRLYLAERDAGKGLFLPFDVFLRSLAEDAGPRAIAMVLSGTGSDGSRGVRAIHEAGGLVMAQSEDSAKFDGMPRNAVDTGLVDLIQPPEGLADALLRFLTHHPDLGLEQPDEQVDTGTLGRILSLMQRECGVDFSEYKSSTVGRRIERRLLLSDTRDLEAYLKKLESDPRELRSLYQDMLIGVTRFFRDGEAFQRLRTEVIPELVRRLSPHEEFRVWVPGCATGEEAYSMAMLVAEAYRVLGRGPTFRVFATDVHRASLDVASAGQYSLEAAGGVPDDLRDRYLERKAEGLHVVTQLRERVVFAHHNVIKDAPFTRLDLLTCRNLLIYFTPSAQRKAISLFHFGLKTNGVLMLGPSESPGPLSEEFAALDNRWKIFRKHRDVRLTPHMRLDSLPGFEGSRGSGARIQVEDPRIAKGRDLLFQRYLPPAVVVDGSARILHTWGGAGELFVQRDGPPSTNLLELLEGELRYAVSAALKRAQKERAQVSLAGLGPIGKDEAQRMRVVVEGFDAAGRGEDCWLVTFERQPLRVAEEGESAARRARPPTSGEDLARIDDLMRERVLTLESELRQARESLQATVEETETSNEELQATNEELIASNEELQSTNEELHSVNEELYTVNAEYQAKIAELTELTADVNNLLEGTEVHTLFLDPELKIRKFTPKIGESFNLLPQDVGRRFDTFAHTLDDDRLFADLKHVLETGESVQREVTDRRGATYFLRILPYTGREGGGTVLTLIDISQLKLAQRELALKEERYRTLVRSMTSILWTAEADGRFGGAQPEWEQYTGQDQATYQDHGWLEAFAPEDRPMLRARWRDAVAAERPFEAEARIFSKKHGEYRHAVVQAAPLQDGQGRVRVWLGYVLDRHEARMSELALRRKDEQVRAIVAKSPAFIHVKDTAGRYLLAGQQSQSLLGVPAQDLIGKTDYDFRPPADADRVRAVERRVLESGESAELEDTFLVDGEPRSFLTVYFPLNDEQNTVYALGGISTDITERRRAVEEANQALERRDRFLAMLSHELRTPLGAILNASNLLTRQLEGNGSPGLEVIRRQARHMAKLIDDLLDIGRITRDEVVLDSLLVDVRALVTELLENFRNNADDAGVALLADVPDEPVWVRGDALRLRQVFANLLSNAILYTPRGGRVLLKLGCEEGRAQISLRDTGIGLAPEERERIFDLFYQAPQPIDRPRGGLGIGLTLAQRLVRLHGGEIEVSSEGRDRGSTFSLSLPLAERPDACAASQSQDVPRRKLRIAIVEDNQDIRETLRELLSLDGHEVLIAEDGKIGLDLIVRERPDLALIDVGLPRLDGYEVARRIKETFGGTTRVVALTGYGRQEDRLKAIQAGFDEHFVKPVEVEALTRLLADVEARKRADA